MCNDRMMRTKAFCGLAGRSGRSRGIVRGSSMFATDQFGPAYLCGYVISESAEYYIGLSRPLTISLIPVSEFLNFGARGKDYYI